MEETNERLSYQELFTEVRRLRQKNLELRQEITFDKLTGFYKEEAARSKILQILREHFLDQEQPVSVSLVLMDLDGLGNLNDRYDHEVGNEAIRKFGQFLREEIIPLLSQRDYPNQGIEEPFFAFRSFERGDEFGLILCGVGGEEGQKIAQELQATSLTFEFEFPRDEKKRERISFSVGFASTDEQEIIQGGKKPDLTLDSRVKATWEALKRGAESRERINKQERKNG